MTKQVSHILTFIVAMASALLMNAQQGLRPRGDVNCDWEANIGDINALTDSIFKGAKYHHFYGYAADVNDDREYTIADINMVLDAIMGAQLPPMPSFSGTLPVLYINTEGHRDIVSKEKEDYLHADWWLDAMGLEGQESIGSADAPLGMLIKGRGNYTWDHYDKKSFRIKLDEKQPLMGMDSNRHFCLLAHADDYLAMLKNTMGLELSRRIGMAYTPAQAPVEVVLNGRYIGLYFLTEKIRVGKHRVNIEEQNDLETDPARVTGGWLLEMANTHEGTTMYFHEGEGDGWVGITPHSPEELSRRQYDYIWNYLNNATQAIYNADKTSTEWEKYIDIDTMAMFYIIGEIMDDLEHFAGSAYMYKHAGDTTRLVFGPVWDFGNSFQRWAIFHDTTFQYFLYEQPTVFTSHWITEVAKYPHFQQVVRRHWQEFHDSGFNGLNISQFIDDHVESIRAAYEANQVLWGHPGIDIEKEFFKTFIHRKINWLQSQWGTDEP